MAHPLQGATCNSSPTLIYRHSQQTNKLIEYLIQRVKHAHSQVYQAEALKSNRTIQYLTPRCGEDYRGTRHPRQLNQQGPTIWLFSVAVCLSRSAARTPPWTGMNRGQHTYPCRSIHGLKPRNSPVPSPINPPIQVTLANVVTGEMGYML